MKILNISLDPTVLDIEQKKAMDNNRPLSTIQRWSKKYWKRSKTAKRIISYGDVVDRYYVIAVSKYNTKEQQVSGNVLITGVDTKIKLFGLYKILKKTWLELKKNKSNQYDVITVQDTYYLALLEYGLSKLFNVGLEIQVHGFEKFSWFRKFIAKFIIHRANSVRVVSGRLKKQLIQDFNVEDSKITVARVYRKKLKIKKNKKLLTPRDNSKFIFLTVSRLVPVKNINLQIKALANVIKKLKIDNLQLKIIGEGSERKELESLCDQLKISSYVEFLGYDSNVQQAYHQADCFLLTSNSEGWGTVIEEAGWASLPIIMTDVGLAGEVIKNNESGIIIPIGDQSALEYAMIRLIENEDLRKKLGAGAYQAIQTLPNQEQTIKKMIASWEKAMKNK